MYLLLYVDDIFVVCDSVENLYNLKLELSKRFKISNVLNSDVNRFLGVDIKWNKDKGEMTISQFRYIEFILRKFRMLDCNLCKTPMEFNLKLKSSCDESIITQKPFQQLLGSLNYIAGMTRLDICFAVNRLGQFQRCPTEELYRHAKRIWRYLKGTMNMTLSYHRSSSLNLKGYADADFGSDTADRKSRTGYAFYLGDSILT